MTNLMEKEEKIEYSIQGHYDTDAAFSSHALALPENPIEEK